MNNTWGTMTNLKCGASKEKSKLHAQSTSAPIHDNLFHNKTESDVTWNMEHVKFHPSILSFSMCLTLFRELGGRSLAVIRLELEYVINSSQGHTETNQTKTQSHWLWWAIQNHQSPKDFSFSYCRRILNPRTFLLRGNTAHCRKKKLLYMCRQIAW